MAHHEIIGRGIGEIRILVGERGVRVPDNLAEAVVLHHDHEDVVQIRYALGTRSHQAPNTIAADTATNDQIRFSHENHFRYEK